MLQEEKIFTENLDNHFKRAIGNPKIVCTFEYVWS